MAEKKVWVGSMGPMLFDDTDPISDDDGDLPGTTHAALSTTGQMHVTQAPTEPDNVARFGDVESAITNAHVQNTDVMLSSGTSDQVTAAELRTMLNNLLVITVPMTVSGFDVPDLPVTASGIKLGKTAVLFLPTITGTSNANNMGISFPVDWRASISAFFIIRVINNGVFGTGVMRVSAAASINSAFPDMNVAHTWSTTGTKGIYGITLIYRIP